MSHEYRSCNDVKKNVLPNEVQECMNYKEILRYYYHNKSYLNLHKPLSNDVYNKAQAEETQYT